MGFFWPEAPNDMTHADSLDDAKLYLGDYAQSGLVSAEQ